MKHSKTENFGKYLIKRCIGKLNLRETMNKTGVNLWELECIYGRL